MAGWQEHQGQAVALPMENIDTDQIMPARFMSTPRSEGYGGFLFHDLAAGDAAFPLNAAPEASILIAKRNFGCGSSREAAVYGLVDAGFRAVLAPSFGEIFAANAVNNGLLPAVVKDVDALIAAAPALARIDLAACEFELGAHVVAFEIDPVWRKKLMKGWDDIDLTRAEGSQIGAYRDARKAAAPWLWPETLDP